jgi:cell division protein FtsW (lipid II flippase)
MQPRLRAVVYGPLYLVIFGASIAVVAGATWLGVSLLHRAPINWIGIYACVLGFLFYATRETLPADILGSIEHLAWVRWLQARLRRFGAFLKFEEDRLLAPRPPPTAPSAEKPAEPPSDTRNAEEAPAHVQS